MSSPFPFFPVGASSVAGEVDMLYLFIVAVCAFFTVLVAALIVYFTLRYKRQHANEVGADIHGSLTLELAWTFIPFVLSMVMFGWGAKLFFDLASPPANAMEIFVVGKQWMWKVQHPEGVREINELHVPVGRPVRLTMGSEDVLHDFSIPAFRVKMDVVPGKLTTMWFEATAVGTYHIFCAEYCGTKHSGMIGQVTVMSPQDYEVWLAGGKSTGTAAQNGERLFTDLACVTCHKPDASGRGPSLAGVFGSKVTLTDGRTVVADENYLRESIMNSQAKVVQGYQGIMPTFQGMVTEENLMQLIAYIKTLKPAPKADAPHGLKSWLLTKDHKRIAMLYLISITIFFAVGGLFALGIRIELLTPKGDFVTDDVYNKLFTLHGIVMIFFFLIPSIPATLGNFFIPIMCGTKDLAFPRINLLSWYLYVIGGVLGLAAIIGGGVDTGWTFYTPYSTTASQTSVTIAAVAAFVAGFSSILTGFNFIVTVHRMRAPGLTWFRLPLFVWAHYATSLVMILGTPVIAITLVLLMSERALGLGIFDPKLGGDPVLFQHLFWFYSHPAVYIMILPGMGVVSELVAAISRKQIFGYTFVAFSSIAIAILGFLVWGHHLFVSSQSIYAGLVFSIITMLVAVPSAVKTFNWTATMYKGSVTWESPTYWVIGFMGLFLIGGLTGLFLATLGLDIHLTDTYFVVAHFHYIMVGGAIMAFMGGLHFYWPKMTGRMYPESFAKASAILVFVGFNLTFFPQFILGYLGMPRRYHSYPEEFQVWNVFSTGGATILGLGYGLCLVYLVWSIKRGAIAPPNPWGAKGLEWEKTQSPPTTFNFDEDVIVTEPAYNYAPGNKVHHG